MPGVGQYQGTELKMKEKLQEKAIRLKNFMPSHASVLKEINDLKILNLKDFITLQKK